MLNSEYFEDAVKALGIDFSGVSAVGVAVSGGPDSMALCGCLREWAASRGITVHALHVDHGLREESGAEAGGLRAVIPDVKILKWDGQKPDAAIQEEARRARYGLMAEYCKDSGVQYLFLGHHRDDQAETVLFRLAKGSGLDGLAGMQGVQAYEGLQLLRPLLDVPKAALVEYCDVSGLDTVQDPSNQNEMFARVRIRQSADILAEEGLSAKRLAVTAKRLTRARIALNELSTDAYKEAILNKNTKQIVLKYNLLQNQPEEIILRVILKALEDLRPNSDYAPRMEKIETLIGDLMLSESFRKRTLGGVIFERNDKDGTLRFCHE